MSMTSVCGDIWLRLTSTWSLGEATVLLRPGEQAARTKVKLISEIANGLRMSPPVATPANPLTGRAFAPD
jgi:hypothetical protein